MRLSGFDQPRGRPPASVMRGTNARPLVQWTTPCGNVAQLTDSVWIRILTYLPEEQGYKKDMLRYDPLVTAIKFGSASRSCRQIASHQPIASKAQALLEKKRQ